VLLQQQRANEHYSQQLQQYYGPHFEFELKAVSAQIGEVAHEARTLDQQQQRELRVHCLRLSEVTVHEAEEQILDSERNCDENNDFFEAADVFEEVFEVLSEGFEEKKVAADAKEHKEIPENEVHRKQHFAEHIRGEGKF